MPSIPERPESPETRQRVVPLSFAAKLAWLEEVTELARLLRPMPRVDARPESFNR